MLILYTTPMCPYCKRVEAYLDEAQIAYEERNVATNPAFRDELLEKGGNMQVPFLVDTERDVSMYESEDMLNYIAEHYAR